MSGNVDADTLATKLNDTTTPVITWALSTWANLKMSDFGAVFLDMTTLVVEASPLTVGITPVETEVVTEPDHLPSGKPTSDAVVGASVPSIPNKRALYAYAPGAALTDGSPAPGARVALFLGDTSASNLNATGEQLVRQTLAWALNQPFGAEGLKATRYYSFGGSTVALRETSGGENQVHWLVGNHQRSLEATIAAGTSTIDAQEYQPYGAPRLSGEQPTERGWIGQTRDTELGLVDLNARYYDSYIGRFISVDPLASPSISQTLNPYSYSYNNPVTHSDPSGLDPQCRGKNARAGCSFLSGHYKYTYNVYGFQTQWWWWYGQGAAPAPSYPQSQKLTDQYKKEMGTSVDKQYVAYKSQCAYDVADCAGAAALEYGATPNEAAAYSSQIAIESCGNTMGCDIGAALDDPWGNFVIDTIATMGTGYVAKRAAVGLTGRVLGGGSTTRVAATGDDLLGPGPWAAESVSSSAPGRITQAERDLLNPIGDTYGCHSCGATSPGTSSGNWVGDHQPVTAMVPAGTPQVLYPQCISCSRSQGLHVINIFRQQQRI